MIAAEAAPEGMSPDGQFMESSDVHFRLHHPGCQCRPHQADPHFYRWPQTRNLLGRRQPSFQVRSEQVEECDWYEIKANAPHLITLIEKHIKKGDQIIIVGSQSHRSYQLQDGQNGFAVEIFALDIRLNISKKSDETSGARQDEEEPAF